MSGGACTVVGGLGALSSMVAAGLWFYGSILKVPDNQDTFIKALQKINRWNTYAAIATALAALCGAYLFGAAGQCR